MTLAAALFCWNTYIAGGKISQTRASSVRGDLVSALGAPLTGVGLLPVQSGVDPPYDDCISGPYYSTACDAYKLAIQKATANALLMSGLAANLAFYQSVDLASGESRLDDDVQSARSKRVQADDGDGVTVDRGNVTSLG